MPGLLLLLPRSSAAVLRPLKTAIDAPLKTAIDAPPEFAGPDAPLAFERTRTAGATVVRLTYSWRSIAPSGAQKPSGFDAADPFDPHYDWDGLDRQVRLAVANGLEPIVGLSQSPTWAQQRRDVDYFEPSPSELGQFAYAAALRYSGRFNLPRVRLWQVWNEPNLYFQLQPQRKNGIPVSPLWYRAMVNAFASAVHSVDASDLVIAGGLAPFTSFTGKKALWGVGPLQFMRVMFCLSKRLKSTCHAQTSFDIWSHHPYTSGGPTHHAFLPDDVSLGDLPKMRRVLTAAIRSGHVVSRHPIQFWVTEFSWDTNPPDPKGVPLRLHARWVAEALYRMWQSGVSLVTWFRLRDDPFPADFIQSGLYFRGRTMALDHPKPALEAFRFPFVAYREPRGVFLWGRTPTSRPGPVLIDERRGSRWRRLASAQANRYGIFSRRLPVRLSAKDYLRARFGGERSLAFSLRRVPDRFFNPFGTLP